MLIAMLLAGTWLQCWFSSTGYADMYSLCFYVIDMNHTSFNAVSAMLNVTVFFTDILCCINVMYIMCKKYQEFII